MMSMLYVKNVPPAERALRVAAGLAVAAVTMATLGGWVGALSAASALGIVVTGRVGFCPASALVGRKLQPRR